MKELLVVFARYPEPGACKTRLIPALGDVGAAQLHEQMTRRTLSWARELRDKSDVEVQVRFFGASANAMRDKFGEDLCYLPQCDGHLGAKLEEATQWGQQRNYRSLAIVGTDCPQINEAYVRSALDTLETHELGIAPATDGGYALIALGRDALGKSELVRALFREKNWGEANVLKDTLADIAPINLRVALLNALSDVDEPEDLQFWEQRDEVAARPEVAVVIPTHGEEPRLRDVLESAHAETTAEVVVVAAGHRQDVVKICAETLTPMRSADANRAVQLNLGAAATSAHRLLFLHGDTVLSPDCLNEIDEILTQEGVVAGAFQLEIESSRRAARWVEWGVRQRSQRFQMPYGDQGIFLNRDTFEQLNGFREQPIMEDYDLVRRLRRMGRIAISSLSVKTSPRRWHQVGFVRTTIVNQLMILGYHVGVSPQRLARLYRGRSA